MPRIRLLLIALLCVSSSPLVAQQATFVGVISDSITGEQLAGVRVALADQEVSVTSDVLGQFELPGVHTGEQTVVFQRPGYKPGAVRIEILVSRPVVVDLGSIALSPLVVELDPVTVEGHDMEQELHLRRMGFFQRSGLEHGTFLTQADIEEQNPRNTSELMRRIPGFRVFTDGSVAATRGIPGLTQGFSHCGVDYYIDGVHADGSTLDHVLPRSIAGMEVYTGAATIPHQFRITGNPKCGAVVIWTRSGGRRRVP